MAIFFFSLVPVLDSFFSFIPQNLHIIHSARVSRLQGRRVGVDDVCAALMVWRQLQGAQARSASLPSHTQPVVSTCFCLDERLVIRIRIFFFFALVSKFGKQWQQKALMIMTMI